MCLHHPFQVRPETRTPKLLNYVALGNVRRVNLRLLLGGKQTRGTQMNSQPYTVVVRHRPLRTGFLVDTGIFVPGSAPFEALIDDLMVHNQQMWGDRKSVV